jgi:tetratricopeptide (TPR) repeat protein
MRSAVNTYVLLLAATAAGLGVGLASPAHSADCPELRITKDVFAPGVSDLAAGVRAAVGPKARPAEWNEVRACFDKFGLGYFRKIGTVKTDPANTSNPVNSQILVLVNGQRYFQAPARAYFAAFHEGTLPPNWLAHDQVGGNQISLGSWSYLLPAFYVVDPPPTPPGVVASPTPDAGRCTAATKPDDAVAACTTVIMAKGVADAALAQAYGARAVAWHNKGEFDQAIADYDQSIRLAPNSAAVFNNRGKAWQAKGNLDRAIADFSEAVRIDPSDQAGAFRFRSIVLRLRGDLDGAIADADRAIRLYPDYNAAYVARGLAYETKGDLTHARADYSVALALPSKYPSGKEAQQQARERLAAFDQSTSRTGPGAPAVVSPITSSSGEGGFARRVALVIGTTSSVGARAALDLT